MLSKQCLFENISSHLLSLCFTKYRDNNLIYTFILIISLLSRLFSTEYVKLHSDCRLILSLYGLSDAYSSLRAVYACKMNECFCEPVSDCVFVRATPIRPLISQSSTAHTVYVLVWHHVSVSLTLMLYGVFALPFSKNQRQCWIFQFRHGKPVFKNMFLNTDGFRITIGPISQQSWKLAFYFTSNPKNNKPRNIVHLKHFVFSAIQCLFNMSSSYNTWEVVFRSRWLCEIVFWNAVIP